MKTAIGFILFLALLVLTESGLAVDYCSGLYSPGNPFQCGPHDKGYGNCTWYARYKRPDLAGICTGNAKQWYAQANSANLAVGQSPVKGSIAVFSSWMVLGGVYQDVGHVAYVEHAIDDGNSDPQDNYFHVTEMGWNTWDGIHSGDYNKNSLDGILGFIYPVGIYSDLSFKPEVQKAFLDAYNCYSTDLGWPHDNGGGVFVHEWRSGTDPRYRVWLQDFKDASGKYTALILDEFNSANKAYKIQEGFRHLYMSGDGPRNYGMPFTEEISALYATNPGGWIGDSLVPGDLITVQKFRQVYNDNGILKQGGRKTMVWKSGINPSNIGVGEFAVNAMSCSGVCPREGDQIYVVSYSSPSDPSKDIAWPYLGHTIKNGTTGKWFTKPGNYNFVLHNSDGSRKQGWGLSVLITEGNSQLAGDYVVVVDVGSVEQTDDYEVGGTWMCEGVESNYPWDCINNETTFYSSDGQVYQLIRFDNVHISLNVTHRWYEPGGAFVSESIHITDPPSSGGYWGWYKVWSSLDISNESRYGQWRVDIYVNGIKIDMKYFIFSEYGSSEQLELQAPRIFQIILQLIVFLLLNAGLSF